MPSVGETSGSRFPRSAGACPPRSLQGASDGEEQARPTKKRTVFFRSAGACPPRSPDLREKRMQTQAVSLSIEAWRGTGPRPTVKEGVFSS